MCPHYWSATHYNLAMITLVNNFCKPLLFSGCIVFTLTSCASSPKQTTHHHHPDDPWESWNRDVQNFNTDFDNSVLKPMAKEYQKTTPSTVDQGVTNFFSNINDIGVSINDLLQLKFIQGSQDLSRFIINSTVGVAGIFDVASKINLPKHNEDFGQTLGFWGIPSGSYMVLPFLGASSPRDAVGLLGDALLNPLTYVSVFGGTAANAATSGSTILDVTDTRSDLMSTEKMLNEASVDRYDFMKQSYKQHREYLIHDGDPPSDDSDPLTDDLLSDQNGNNTETNPVSSNHAALANGLPPTSNDTQSVTNWLNAPESNQVPIIDNSKTLEATIDGPAQVIDQSRRLELSAPE